MSVLSSGLRKVLESACTDGRTRAEAGARAALVALAVTADRPPAHLSEDDRRLRRGLRAKARQLGDTDNSVELLVADVAYEQWHRLLFARFLAKNNLLIHPEYKAPVTLADCEELAESLGEPDGWSVAGGFASQILPGIFRLDDPAVQVRLAPEGRLALEEIVSGLPAEVFGADDALGWVYQFWQKQKKDEVNASERKIGGADLGPVTQLFTENYMVRFLLENSLGAWWAARRPDSPLVKDWEFLRFDDDGNPAAGSFDGWPDVIDEVTVMDPCCGSGHFLVEAFKMLWRMRVEENGLSAVAAQDAVLRDNLFGLELDSRCVQIAMFAVALQGWKDGGGWRELPIPNIACSGIPVKAPVEEWKALANGDSALEAALERLHILFRDADTLGSLIDPKRAVEITDPTGQTSTDDINWNEVLPVLIAVPASEEEDPSNAVLGASVATIARSAQLLSNTYCLITTNVPYLGRTGQAAALREHLIKYFPDGSEDLATAFTGRLLMFACEGGTVAEVLPETALFLGSLKGFRQALLNESCIRLAALLGPGAFAGIGGEVVRAALLVVEAQAATDGHEIVFLDVSTSPLAEKPGQLCTSDTAGEPRQGSIQDDRLCRILPAVGQSSEMLSTLATSTEGISTGDGARYQRNFWELSVTDPDWILFQRAPAETMPYGGLDTVVFWQEGKGKLSRDPGARVQGLQVWGEPGVLVERMSSLRATAYLGGAFQKSTVVVRPADATMLPALWSFCASGEHKAAVLAFERRIGIATSAIVEVPFDVSRWTAAAKESGPFGEPWSDDPTQILFEGSPQTSNDPLQVGISRLLGYCWPGQAESHDVDDLADDDGVTCLPSVLGEHPAADRLQELLARSLGSTWTPIRARQLIEATGSKKKDLETWLRDDFFAAHCKLFQNRPFVWHIWDGRKDGFAALVNYHRLDRSNLERLTYTYLGDWIERQTAGVRDDTAGAEDRLAAAQDLQRRLELILDGEPPYDIYVRWKDLHEQPIGWDPDLNDGVRLNIRPFVQAGVLRSKFNIHWKKDRGKNPDGTERHNDLHYTNAEKLAARKEAAL